MKTRLFLSIFLSICSLWVQAAPPQPTARPVNPALLYWQAAACLPKLSAPQTEELRDMARGKRPVDRRKLHESGFGEIERLLRKATLSEAPCDWGLFWESGPGMALPHLSKLSELATLAVVNAEVLLSEGKAEASFEYFLMAHRIARHAAAEDAGAPLHPLHPLQRPVLPVPLTGFPRHRAPSGSGWDAGSRRATVRCADPK
jgi:hypothetical protein